MENSGTRLKIYKNVRPAYGKIINKQGDGINYLILFKNVQKQNLQFVSQMDDTIDKICTKSIVTLSYSANHGLTSALTWKILERKYRKSYYNIC